jgi:hypothetical protein
MGLTPAIAGTPKRRLAAAAVALVLATVVLGAGPSASRADTGTVFVSHLGGNVAAGSGPLFNGSFTGSDNVGLGFSVMPSLTSGSGNTATGNLALSSDRGGSNNVADGFFSLFNNLAGDDNVAVGQEALNMNNASFNVATGFQALTANTGGHDDTATGTEALRANTSGNFNVAAGSTALLANTTGSDNLGVGTRALQSNTVGAENVASGTDSLISNTSGDGNIAVGTGAGSNLTTGSDNIDIGNVGKTGESRLIRIGTRGTQRKAFLAGVSGTTVSGTAQAVVVNAQGQLGTAAAASTKGSTPRPLSAAAGRRLLATVERQQRQIGRLRALVKEERP